MGRYWTGAKTVKSVERIKLSELFRKEYFYKDSLTSGSIQWENGNSISYSADFRKGKMFVKLSYTLTTDDGPAELDYKIKIKSVPSNLGKGELLYFECPASGKLCRILYRAYGSTIWKSRKAYNQRIYYATQLASKKFRDSQRYFQIEEQLGQLLHKKYLRLEYKGKPTRTSNRIDRLFAKIDRLDANPFAAILKI